MLPAELSLVEFADGTTEETVAFAAHRMDQCVRCPPHGGACHSVQTEERAGYFPIWQSGFVYQRCRRYREFILRERLREAGVPIDLLSKSFEAYQPCNEAQQSALDLCRELATDKLARGVMLVGSTGLGKSHLASVILREQLRSKIIESAMMVYVPTFIHQIDHRKKYEAREEIIQRAIESDLLVLDDLGAEATTSYQQQYLTMIINEREANGRPLIVTSNHHLDHFRHTLGERAYSRLSAMLFVVFIEGEDHRCR